MMKVLIFGPKARYDTYRPDFVSALPVEEVFCPLNRDQLPQGDIAALLRERTLEAARANPDTQVIFSDAITEVGEGIMELLPQLKLIHSEGVAFNRIDLEAARRRGIYVCNNKGCNADSVAEHTVMLMLMALRHGITGDRAVRAGRQIQLKEEVMVSDAPELGGQTVGLVGFGDIAQATARRLAPFGCRLYYYSLHRRPQEVEDSFGVTYLPLEELFATCSILSLHCAVNDQTRGMVDAALLSHVRPGAILVNTARGDLMDNGAVREALLSGRLGGAAFDTLAPEPTPADHPLVALPPEVGERVVYSPHLGGITGGSFRRGHTHMWTNAKRLLEGERPDCVVNGL